MVLGEDGNSFVSAHSLKGDGKRVMCGMNKDEDSFKFEALKIV